VDATFVETPRQRNSREENEKIKNGEIPEEWKKPENADKLAHRLHAPTRRGIQNHRSERK
jgi:hypothetical protein